MKLAHRAIRHLVAILIAFSALALVVPRPADAAPQIKVKRVTFPVTLSDGAPYTIVGYLYYNHSYRNKTLQVAVHGGSYNHAYWDAPSINGHPYSYARFMALSGYAVLAIDQLGAGESSRPDGDFATLPEVASGVHQVLGSLRSDHNPLHHAFDTIVLVGHSLGSATATHVQGAYNDADALVTTGWGNVPTPSPFDPALVAQLLQQPYLVIPPEVRAPGFFHAPAADPAVIAYDSAKLVDVLPRGFVLTAFNLRFDPAMTLVDRVTSPVLVQLGERDPLAPGALSGQEDEAWASTSDVTVQVLPEMGHDFNLHYHNFLSWLLIHHWIGTTVGWP